MKAICINYRQLKWMTVTLVGIVYCGLQVVASAQTPNTLLYRVYQKTQKAKDYIVTANIKSDIPLIKILPGKATIYFKQEDKVKVVSKSILVLPKQGLNNFAQTIKDTISYTAVNTGNEKVGNVNAQILSIIPNDATQDLILAKLWVDTEKSLVLQSQLTTRSSGTMLINYFYKAEEKYGLPDSLVFTVDVKKFKIPKGVAADLNKTRKMEEEKPGTDKKGKIYVRLSNYLVNTGLKDEIFKK